jgi:hypothetical protein
LTGLGPFLASALIRFWLGTVGAMLGGYFAFRGALFQPDHPAFQSLTVGMLTAGVLTLVRLGLRGQALMLALAYGVLQLGITDQGRWAQGIGGLLLGLGLVIVGEIYNELALYGFRFGKFLIVGPLLGGVLLAVAPIVELGSMIPFDAVRPLLLQLFLGVVVGDGAGLGLELAELLPLGELKSTEPWNRDASIRSSS